MTDIATAFVIGGFFMMGCVAGNMLGTHAERRRSVRYLRKHAEEFWRVGREPHGTILERAASDLELGLHGG